MNGSISFNDIQPLFQLIEQEKSFEKRVALLGTRIEKIYIYIENARLRWKGIVVVSAGEVALNGSRFNRATSKAIQGYSSIGREGGAAKRSIDISALHFLHVRPPSRERERERVIFVGEFKKRPPTFIA